MKRGTVCIIEPLPTPNEWSRTIGERIAGRVVTLRESHLHPATGENAWQTAPPTIVKHPSFGWDVEVAIVESWLRPLRGDAGELEPASANAAGDDAEILERAPASASG